LKLYFGQDLIKGDWLEWSIILAEQVQMQSKGEGSLVYEQISRHHPQSHLFPQEERVIKPRKNLTFLFPLMLMNYIEPDITGITYLRKYHNAPVKGCLLIRETIVKACRIYFVFWFPQVPVKCRIFLYFFLHSSLTRFYQMARLMAITTLERYSEVV
jgi:hypothetical protein